MERASAPKRGELVYHEYATGGLHVTYECRNDGPLWEVSEGRAIDAAGVEILG